MTHVSPVYVSLGCSDSFIGVCLSADWTGALVPFLPHISFPPCRTKVLIFSALACMLECNWCTRILVWTLHSLNPALDFECGCVCPQTGQVHSYSVFLPLFWFLFRLAPLLMWLSCWPLFSGFFCSPSSSWCGCEPGTVSLGLSSASACSCRLFLSGVLWPLCFLVVSPRCAAGFLLFVFFSVWFVSPVAAVFCSLFGCFARFCSWCLGLLRSDPLSHVAPSCPSPLG